MKLNKRITACVLTVAPLMAFALPPDDPFPLHHLKVERRNDSLRVSFTLDVRTVTVKSNDWLQLTPCLQADDNTAALPPILLEGRNSRIYYKRNGAKAIGYDRRTEATAYPSRSEEEITYVTQLPYSEWMRGSSLKIERILTGCCDEQVLETVLLAENLVNRTSVQPAVLQPETPSIYASVGDSLAQMYAFVSPINEYDSIRNEIAAGNKVVAGNKIVAGNKNGIFTFGQGALTFYFKVGKSILETDFRENANNLRKLSEVLRQIEQSADSKISKIIISGCVSPEGRKEQNEQLAQERATLMLNRVMAITGLDAAMLEQHIDLTGWQSLRFLVAQSNMEYRQEILNIIDRTPMWNATKQQGRLSALQSLQGGKPYAYLKEHFFPVLRNAGMVKVYFSNR